LVRNELNLIGWKAHPGDVSVEDLASTSVSEEEEVDWIISCQSVTLLMFVRFREGSSFGGTSDEHDADSRLSALSF
jgi:hypothetical protein